MRSKLFILCYIAFTAFWGEVRPASAQPFAQIVAPNNLSSAEGNSLASYPFDGFLGSMRYQQVFDSSQFSAISSGGGYISAIGFRHDGTCFGSDGQAISSLQINLSTTPNAPDSLSPVFANNVGHDDAV